ncbi:phosphohistidine phosphatase SixA [Pseudomonas asuensis]|uniref:Phosphohistidine phosphatase SixA n=1 Tax=Pseudomonas asuensis TaxID=1825787 RepID=A0ABQ2H376_9PSED|nr:phosphohistidine phosphatase SixA [Pseudomonas asuensis]GGM26904.1 phosphohistidine phosphatase SixA [Pseudomonas asuensis]
MRLWLLRHGEAEPRAEGDEFRPLTAKGRDEVRRSAARLLGKGIDAIYASPYVRAQQTAELVKEVLAYKEPIVTLPWITPDDDVSKAIDHLDSLSGRNILLATHNPFVSDLAGFLVYGNRQQPLSMATGSLAVLEGELPIAGAMELIELFHP